jgi:hypothetical protein
MHKQTGNEMYKVYFKESRNDVILQKEFTVCSVDCCVVVFCIRTLSLPILYGYWNTGRYGDSATSANSNNSNDYPFYFHVVCVEETVRENEIGIVLPINKMIFIDTYQ